MDFEPQPYPEAVVRAVAKIAARTLTANDSLIGVDAVTTGPFVTHYTAASSSGDAYLTNADKLALRPYRKGSTSIGVYGNRYTSDS